jgi:uncharacterized protein (TIGR00369 family)
MSDDAAEMLNRHRGGFNDSLGLRFLRATPVEVVAELEVGPQHLQPYGVVHGGVYCAMVETLASSGAALGVMAEGRHAVGLENSTTFVRAVREGRLVGTATPLTRGRRSHVWEVEIRDADDRLAAKGRVRMLCLEGGAQLAGETVALKGETTE